MSSRKANGIGTRRETPLHAALKLWCAGPDACFEVDVDGYIVDVVEGGELIEVQTRSFAKLKRKLAALLDSHPVRLVHPIPREKWVVRLPPDGNGPPARRKSPKRGAYPHLFAELVSFPALVTHPNFSLHVLLTQEEEIRRYDGNRSWRRRGWTTDERRLLAVVDQRLFLGPEDFAALLPPELPDPFTVTELAAALKQPRRLAGQMAYCLREMGALQQVGQRGRAHLYARATSDEHPA